MSKLRQSFSWWCFENRGVEPENLLAGAAKIGYEAVDLVTEPFWPMVRDSGLAFGAVNGHGGIENGLNRREDADLLEGKLKHSIEKAVQWYIPVLICFSGNRHGLDDETGMDVCAETLSRVLPFAEQAGVVLAMELLNSTVDHRDYQCDRTPWGLRLCRRLASPAFGLLYDIYHMQIMEGDLIRTIQRHHRCFVHYHTAGNPGRGPMDAEQEIHYPAVYRAIAATGFQGLVAHEFLPKGDPLVALAAAYEQCAESVR